MVYKVSKSKEKPSGSKESASKESRSKEKRSKERGSKEKGSKKTGSRKKKKKVIGSKEKGSKESGSKEGGSKKKGSTEKVAKKKIRKPKISIESRSKESGSKEKGSKEKESKEKVAKKKSSKPHKLTKIGSKDSRSREKGSKESKSNEKRSKEKQSKETGSIERKSKKQRLKEIGNAIFCKTKRNKKKNQKVPKVGGKVGPKDSKSKEKGSKETGSKEKGSKETGSKEKGPRKVGKPIVYTGPKPNAKQNQKMVQKPPMNQIKTGSKETGSKEKGSKETGSKETGSKEKMSKKVVKALPFSKSKLNAKQNQKMVQKPPMNQFKAGSKETGSKEKGSKETGSKETGSKETGSKEKLSKKVGKALPFSKSKANVKQNQKMVQKLPIDNGKGGLKEKGSKETGSKETGSKERGSKESRSKEKGSKETGSKERGSKEVAKAPPKQNPKRSQQKMPKFPGSKKGSRKNGSKESGSKESGSKESGSKEKGSKEKGSKESRSKDKGSKENGSKKMGWKEKGKALFKPTNKGKQNENEKKPLFRNSDEKNNSKAKKKELRFWMMILGICAIILAMIIICLSLYFLWDRGPAARLPPLLCISKVCNDSSKFLKSSSKFTVSPCTDFYEHVCGNYNRTNSIKFERHIKMLKLNSDSFFNPKLVSPARDKIKQVQTACLKNQGSLLLDIINSDIGLYGWLPTLDVAKVDFTNRLIEILKVTPSIGIFHLSVVPTVDAETKETRMKVFLLPPVLKTDDFKKEFLAVRSAVNEARNPGGREKKFEQQAIRANRLYNDLTNHKGPSDPTEYFMYRQPMSSEIDWKRIANALSPGLYQSFHDPMRMDALLDGLLAKHQKETFIDLMYFAWFKNTAYSPLCKENPCGFVFPELFPDAFGYFYLYANIDLKNKDEIMKMAEKLKESTIEVVNESKWIDKMTKKMIVYKLKAMKYYIGYDGLYENVTEFEKLYRTLKYNNTASFFQMVQDVQKWETKMSYDVVSGVRKLNYTMKMIEMDANYFHAGNLVYVALGLFSFPYYHRESPVYLNYGGTGFAIGHETGRSLGLERHMSDYSGLGYLNSDPKYTLTIQRLTSCLANYYSDQFKIDGNSTLEENSADVIGLRTTIRAMKEEIKNSERDILLPGFEKTSNEQMFFYSFVANMCGGVNEKARINGALSLSEDFAKAFQCKRGTKMNPAKKCQYYGE